MEPESYGVKEEPGDASMPQGSSIYPEATRGMLRTDQPLAADQSSGNGRKSRKLFGGQSRAYLAEYALLMIVTISLLWLSTSMFGSILDYIGGKFEPSWGERFAYTSSLATLAGVIVLLPVIIGLNRRTLASEQVNNRIKNLGWRKGFLSFFLIVITLSAIGFATTLTYDLVSWIASQGLGTSDGSGFWKDLVKHLFGTVLFGFTAWLYARDYRANDTNGLHGRLGKFHHYSLVLIALVLAVVFVIFPLRVQRNGFIDDTVVSDLREIKSKVETHERENHELPNSLDNLRLNDEQKAHAKAYKYEYKKNSSTSYELCAEFKTDTKDKTSGPGNPLERFAGTSYYEDYYREQEEDPDRHSKGQDCFNYELIRSNFDESSNFDQSSSTDNFSEQ